MRRQRRGEERRRQILYAALGVIGREGIGAVTHRTVASVAEVPLGSLTYYFASKEDLLREALLLFVEEETARLRAIGEALEVESLPPAEIAARFAAVLTGEDPENVAQFELYLEAARVPALREQAAACFAAYEEVARIALRAAGLPEPGPLPALMVALADGAGLRRLASPGSERVDLAAGLVALFESAVARTPV